jgi:hypothetical protein
MLGAVTTDQHRLARQHNSQTTRRVLILPFTTSQGESTMNFDVTDLIITELEGSLADVRSSKILDIAAFMCIDHAAVLSVHIN